MCVILWCSNIEKSLVCNIRFCLLFFFKGFYFLVDFGGREREGVERGWWRRGEEVEMVVEGER